MDDAPEWDRPVFAAGARKLTIRDVIAAADFRGELDLPWAQLCQVPEDADFEADDEAVQAASEQFRSDRDLITAEETEQWLEQRGLTIEEFGDYFVRREAKKALGAEANRPSMAYADAPPELKDLLRIDLIVGGEFDRMAERLAWRFAAWNTGAAEPAADWREELGQMEAAYQELCASLLTAHSRADALQSLRLSLTRFELEVLEVESHDAANEALLCLRVDGESMQDVAHDGHYPLRHREVHVGEVTDEMRSPLLSARLGDVLGPYALGEAFLIGRLVRKIEPALTDDAVRERVDQFIVERHFSEILSQHVRWILAPAQAYAPAT
jgi:hypothetical protein